MTIHYEVTRFHHPISSAASYSMKHRAPAARDALWAAVYDMLEANGLRDRPVAYRLLGEVEAAEVSPPPPGHYRSQRFRLGGSYFDEVHLFVYREA